MRIHRYIYILCILLLASCSNTKHLPEGDSLFIGGKVKILDNEAPKKTRKVLTSDLAGSIRPKPNTKALGVRLKLSLYNLAGQPKKEKGFRAWLRNKVGEPPVLYSTVSVQTNKDIMVNVMQNRGFFYPSITTETITKRKKTRLVFKVKTGRQYMINDVVFERDSSNVSKRVYASQKRTILKKGYPYNLDVIKGERSRIEKVLKRKGYYYFRADDILIKVDSSIGQHRVNLMVTLKGGDMKQEDFTAYTINNIYVYPNYHLKGKASDTDMSGAVLYKDFYIVDVKKKFRPELFPQNIQFEKGQLYNINFQNNSISRLVNLGEFKFVKNRFDVTPESDTMLNVYYYFTPYPKYALRFQIGALTQNDNRMGSQASISWINRNTFRGAEMLQLKLSGGFDAQYSGETQRPNIYNVGAEASLSFPRFIVPFGDIKTGSAFTPRTIIKGGYSYESQSDLLRINSYKISYGYNWKENARKEHQLFPINFTYIKTDTLGNADALNSLYGELIFNGIIIGPTYEFTYNSQTGRNTKPDNYYFDGLIDMSGNVLGIVQHADYETNQKTIFGSVYAQYIKLQPDFRYYHYFTKGSSLATRVFLGAGIPIGNSAQLPNVKQFYAGGNSSLRGFPSRLVGPGTFYYNADGKQYLQTLGDLKLELNAEWRYNVYKFINTAVFADAGNIWLYNDNPDLPGGKFTSAFLSQLAVDVGLGLRFDFKIFILRLDAGMPVRKPWLPEADRWTFNDVGLSTAVFNLAIGYPF